MAAVAHRAVAPEAVAAAEALVAGAQARAVVAAAPARALGQRARALRRHLLLLRGRQQAELALAAH